MASERYSIIELPEEIIQRVAQDLNLNDASRVPSRLIIAAIPADRETDIGRVDFGHLVVVP